MPRPPSIASAISDLSANVFSKFIPKIAALSGEVFPLHIGDTWLEPVVKMQDLISSDNPGLHRYSRPVGHPIQSMISDDREVSRIVVTAGVTGAYTFASGSAKSGRGSINSHPVLAIN